MGSKISTDKPGCFILLNGDIVDFYKLSSWLQDPRYRNTQEELDVVTQFLEELRRNFPTQQIIYKAKS